MSEVKNITDLVKENLYKEKKARDSDDYLYYLICKEKLENKGTDINSISLAEGLLNRNELGLPSYKSVERSRRKMQETYPELASSTKVKKCRDKQEQIYREYAKIESSNKINRFNAFRLYEIAL